MKSIKERVEYLFVVKYPILKVSHNIDDRPYIVENATAPTTAELAELEAAKAYLSYLHKFSIDDPKGFSDFADEEAQSFNQPYAFANAEVYNHWVQVRQWKLDHALLLLMRRNPRYVTWDLLRLLFNKSPFARNFAELRTIAISHFGGANGQLSDPVDPVVFLKWAQRYKKVIPPELLMAMQEYECNERVWQDDYNQKEAEIERWKSEYNALASQIREQATKIEELEAQINTMVPKGVDNEAAAVGPWPWGEYETRDLRFIAEAVEKYWVRHDPNQVDTAPTNKTVEKWLINVKGVAASRAETMASLIRPDKLVLGRRPGNK